jgi:hypothetical protein
MPEDRRALKICRHLDRRAAVLKGVQVLDDYLEGGLVHAQSDVHRALLSR